MKECSVRIEQLMNPDKDIIRDQIKVMAHIDSHSSPHTFLPIKSIKAFKRANLDGQKLVLKSKTSPVPHSLFTPTINTPNDLLSINPSTANVKESNVMANDDINKVRIGEGAII